MDLIRNERDLFNYIIRWMELERASKREIKREGKSEYYGAESS